MTKNEIIGMILSICGMIITVISFQVKEKKKLLIFQTMGNIFYLVSYIFSKGGIAVYLNIIYVVRNFIFMYFDTDKCKKVYLTAGVLCLLYIVSYIIFISTTDIDVSIKIWNILPVVGAVFGTVAVTNKDVNKLRLWKYGDSASWLIFNIYIGLGALGGILGEIFNIISLTVGIIRFKKSK